MIEIIYRHPLHGEQTLRCKELVNKDGVLHVVNIHGVTFQTIDGNRILSVKAKESI